MSALLWLLSALVAGAPARAAPAAAPAHIVIASEGARPPYNFLAGDRLEGFEIDLGTELCRRMDVVCTFVAQTWDDMIPGLLAQRYDAIMAAMEINKQRLTRIAFSTPYVRMPSAFLVRRDEDLASARPDDLTGKRIGVEKGGTHQAFVEKAYSSATLVRYTSLDDAILDLAARRIDAALGDKDAISTFLKTRQEGDCCRILADVPRDPTYFGDGIGVGLRKEDTALRVAFDKAIASAIADGTLARISSRYFDFPIDDLPGPPAEQH